MKHNFQRMLLRHPDFNFPHKRKKALPISK